MNSESEYYSNLEDDEIFQIFESITNEMLFNNESINIVADNTIIDFSVISKNTPQNVNNIFINNNYSIINFCNITPADFEIKNENNKNKYIKSKNKIYKFLCPECSSKFKTQKELDNHINRCHICIKNYICKENGCDYAYTTYSSLALHIRRIHGDKIHKCVICSKDYAIKGDLRQHMKRKHGKELS